MLKGNILNYFNYKATRNELSPPAYYFHNHDGLEILYCYEGNGHVIVDDRFYVVQPHTLMIFKPYQLHLLRMEVPPRYTCSLMMVNPAFFDSCTALLPGCQRIITTYLNEETLQIFQLDESQHEQLDGQMVQLRSLRC